MRGRIIVARGIVIGRVNFRLFFVTQEVIMFIELGVIVRAVA